MAKSRTAVRPLRPAAGLVGLALLVGAAFAAEMAVGHMAARGAICGAATSHCAWCYAAVALLMAGLAALAAALRPQRVNR